MNGPPDPGRNPFDHAVGRVRNRIQNRVFENLKRIPGIIEVRWETSGTGIGHQIRGDVETRMFANGCIPTDDAYLQVNWWPQSAGDDNWFQIHYTDATGFDCGWHRQKNDHVDGLDHYQERDNPDADYEYEPVAFDAENPIGILWETVDERLTRRLCTRYE